MDKSSGFTFIAVWFYSNQSLTIVRQSWTLLIPCNTISAPIDHRGWFGPDPAFLRWMNSLSLDPFEIWYNFLPRVMKRSMRHRYTLYSRLLMWTAILCIFFSVLSGDIMFRLGCLSSAAQPDWQRREAICWRAAGGWVNCPRCWLERKCLAECGVPSVLAKLESG